MTRILLIGRNGQVGFELANRLTGLGELVVTGREQIDLARPSSIRSVMREIKPGLIINAAAYTAVDRAESESELAMAINGTAPAILAEEAKRLSAALIHYSTDYVFDGLKQSAYVEDDPTCPLNSYGRSKLAGEQAIVASGIPHLIFRTSWVYGTRGANFMLTMLRLAGERERIQVVNDQFGVPTSSPWLAQSTVDILGRLGAGPGRFADAIAGRGGIYHLVPGGSTTWYDFASSILVNASRMGGSVTRPHTRKAPILEPIRTEQYPVRTPRPKYSVLANGKATLAFGLDMPPWQAVLDECMSRPWSIWG